MGRRLMLARLLLVALLAVSVSARADTTAQTIVHLLDYVGVDYPEAVEDGKVKNQDEFKEMVEFTTQVVALLKTLPANPRQASLAADAERLAKMVEAKASAAEIAAAAGKLRWAVIGAYKLSVAPKAAPDFRTGGRLYQSLCASCHGAEGKGDGPAGAKLEPVPSNFHDAQRMAQRSAYGLYNTITLGVSGTGMASYKQLTEDERWALAFFIAGIPSKENATKGEALWKSGKDRLTFPDLRSVATVSASDVSKRFGADAVAVQAYLLAHPEALAQGTLSPIAFSLATLDQALAAYRKGERAPAQQLAITAYLEGFELAEAGLQNVDPQLMRDTERAMMELRAQMTRGAPLEAVEKQYAAAADLLKQAEERLAETSLSPGATFASALLILLREGLEAILVLAAIIAFLVKTGRRDALPYVHAGWASAFVLGIVTWFAASRLISVSGANREITEGVTALIAVAILLYVGFWLHDKAHAQRWQHFIKEQVASALGKRTLWAMAAVSFLAVYRELFEIVLFYEALWAQVGAGGQSALLGGIATAAVILLAVGWTIFKYSLRLPIGPFFTVTSVLLALLAVVFAGQGVAALQEAGKIPANVINFITAPALGIFPTVQSLGAQLVVLLIVIGGFYFAGRGGRSRDEQTETQA